MTTPARRPASPTFEQPPKTKPKYNCSICGQDYSSAEYHRRSQCSTKNTIGCKYPSGALELTRRDGVFQCAHCEKCLRKPSDMQRHAKSCVPMKNPSSDLQDSPTASQTTHETSAKKTTAIDADLSSAFPASNLYDQSNPQTSLEDHAEDENVQGGSGDDAEITQERSTLVAGSSLSLAEEENGNFIHSLQPLVSDVLQHPNQTNASEISASGLETLVSLGPDDIVDGLFLRTPFVLNKKYWALICTDCKKVIPPASAFSHLGQHPQCKISNNFQTELLLQYPELMSGPIPPLCVVPAIYGLNISKDEYVVCSRCWHAYKDKEVLRKHQCQPLNSGRIDSNRDEPLEAHVQTFDKGGRRHFFPVFIPESIQPTTTTLSPFDLYKKSRRAAAPEVLPESSHPEDFRQLQFILRKEGWLDHVKGYPPGELTALIALPPANGEFSSIPSDVLALMQHLQESMTGAGQVAQRVVGRRPADGHTGIRFIYHHAVEAPTLKRYAQAISQLVVFILRCHKGWNSQYSMRLSQETHQKSNELIAYLDGSQSGSAMSGRTVECDVDSNLNHPNDYDDVFHLEEDEEDADPIEEIAINGQTKSGDDVENIGESHQLPLPDMQRLILDLLRTLYTQFPTGHDDKHYSPVFRFIILRCYQDNGSWLPIRTITLFYSIFAFCGRLAIFDIMLELIAKNPGMRFYEAADRVLKYLDESGEGPLPTLYLLKRPLDVFAQNEGTPFTFTALDFSGQNIIVNGQELWIAGIRRTVETLMTEIKETLKNTILFGLSDLIDVEKWHPGTIDEQPRNTRPGYSCMTDPNNPPLCKKDWLLRIVLENPDLRGHFYCMKDNQVVWNATACLTWLEQCHELEMKFFVAAQLTVGEPARGTEFASHTIRNIPGGNIRNVFVLFQYLTLMGTYNKTTNFKHQNSTILRVPLPELSRIWLLYLCLVRPLVEIWQEYFNGPAAGLRASNNLFFGFHKVVTSQQLSISMVRSTKRILGIAINISLWRHIVTWFLNHHSVKFQKHLSMASHAAFAAQMGHSEGPGGHSQYAADRRLPSGIGFHSCFLAIETCGTWQELLGFEAVLLKSLNEPRARITSGVDETRSCETTAVTSSAEDVYALLKNRLLPEIGRMQSQARASDFAALIRFMRTETTQDVNLEQKANIVDVHPCRLWDLRRLLNDPNALFKTPQQAEAVELLFMEEPNLLIVGPTGSGKTLPIMLNISEYDQGKTTVFILPLLAMHPEYISRAQRFNISVEKWKGTSAANGSPQVVLVAVENCDWDPFKMYLSSLVVMKRLARIVVDEVHLFETQASFRSCFEQLQHIGQTPAPLVILTATCPVAMESRLFKIFGREMYRVLRQTTDRPELAQHFVPVYNTPSEFAFEKEVATRITGLVSNLQPGERMLLFCLSKDQCDRMSDLLGWHPYHSVVTLPDRAASMEEWKQGSLIGLACTSMLNCCLDYPSVRFVFHLGLPRDVIDYYQAIGRCARDGNPGSSFVYYDPDNLGKAAPVNDVHGRGVILEMVKKNDVCRRVLPGKFLDGTGVPCSVQSKGIYCDVCTRHATSHQKPTTPDNEACSVPLINLPPSTDAQFPVMLSAAYSATLPLDKNPKLALGGRLREAFDILDKCCTYCWVNQWDSAITHTLAQCDKSEALRENAEYIDWVDSLVPPEGHCYFCGCSPALEFFDVTLQSPMQVHDHEFSTKCHWQHIFKPVSYFVFETLNEAIRFFLPRGTSSKDDFRRWLLSEDEKYGVVNLNILPYHVLDILPLPFVDG